MMAILRILDFTKKLLQEHIEPGDWVVDATVGNGHDTIFLAEQVGPTGHVFGFDIQKQAIENTQLQLTTLKYLERVTLFHSGHENMLSQLEQIQHETNHSERYMQQISAVTFNLGYLPGGDHQIKTQSPTSLAALEQALNLIKVGGIVTLVIYRGHDGGADEAKQIERFCSSLPQKQFDVLRYELTNQKNTPPYLLAICKKAAT